MVVAEAVLRAAERSVLELLEKFQNLLAVRAIRVDAIGRDLIVREWLLSLRIDDGDQVTIEIPRLAEVTGDFIRRRHARLARVLRHELLLPFLREEEKELVFQRLFRQQHRAADVVALLIVAIKVTRILQYAWFVGFEAIGVIEKRVGVELFVAVEIVASAVELARAGLGHDLDCAASRTSIL